MTLPTVYRCPFCKQGMTDDMSVLVDLEGTLTLVCEVCVERGEEAANVEEPDAE